MKNIMISLCLCLVSTLTISDLQTSSAVVNWTELNQFEYLSHQNKQAITIKLDAKHGLAEFQVSGKTVKQHTFNSKKTLLPSRLSKTLKFPYYNIADSGILLKNACGGRRAIFDRTMATYVNALSNGASQATLDALAAAVWDAFSEWMFCMIK